MQGEPHEAAPEALTRKVPEGRPQKHLEDVSELYRALGEAAGIEALVQGFYAQMTTDARFARIADMHDGQVTHHAEKLSSFLTAWLGGPDRYTPRFGHTALPLAHGHLAIGSLEVELWLDCMREAATARGIPAPVLNHLIGRLAVPASRIVARCSHGASGERKG